MTDFVEECRNEWRRLGVADPVADEMAAELAADLAEAEADGASPDDVLGSGAADPRALAAAWAAERGVVPRPSPSGHGRLRVVAAIGTFALLAIVGAVLVIAGSPSSTPRLAVASPVEAPPPGAMLVRVDPPAWAVRMTVEGPPPVAVSPDGMQIVVRGRPLRARPVAIDIEDSGVSTRAVGSVLLTAGLAGVLSLAMFWLLVGRSRNAFRLEP